jgi:hypothetical protein
MFITCTYSSKTARRNEFALISEGLHIYLYITIFLLVSKIIHFDLLKVHEFKTTSKWIFGNCNRTMWVKTWVFERQGYDWVLMS